MVALLILWWHRGVKGEGGGEARRQSNTSEQLRDLLPAQPTLLISDHMHKDSLVSNRKCMAHL